MNRESQPLCPRCGGLMQATVRAPKRPDSGLLFGDGSPLPPRTLPVWRCADCGIDRPRFDDEPASAPA